MPSKNFPSTFETNMENLEAGFTIDNITYNHTYNKDESDIIRTSPDLQRPLVTETLEVILNLNRKGSWLCLLYTSPSPRDRTRSRMPSSA